MRAELAHDAGDPTGFPRDGLPEVAVLGRSNVGKSTLINALVGRKKLARTSATPGKTRRIHFYRLDERAYLVDLPGYGYAAVSREERRTWKPMVESYLSGAREPLRGAVLLVDARRGPEVEEMELLAWLDAQGVPVRMVLTKADKLKQSQLPAAEKALAEQTSLLPEHVAAVSGKTGRGLRRLGAWMREWTQIEATRPDGSPLL